MICILAIIICANRIFRKSWDPVMGTFFCSMWENRETDISDWNSNFENNNNDSIILISEMTELKILKCQKLGPSHGDVFLLNVPSFTVFNFWCCNGPLPISAGFYFGCVAYECAGRFNKYKKGFGTLVKNTTTNVLTQHFTICCVLLAVVLEKIRKEQVCVWWGNWFALSS